MNIPFPTGLPLQEQRRIVRCLDGAQQKAGCPKVIQTHTVSDLDALLPSVLDKALRGKL